MTASLRRRAVLNEVRVIDLYRETGIVPGVQWTPATGRRGSAGSGRWVDALSHLSLNWPCTGTAIFGKNQMIGDV